MCATRCPVFLYFIYFLKVLLPWLRIMTYAVICGSIDNLCGHHSNMHVEAKQCALPPSSGHFVVSFYCLSTYFFLPGNIFFQSFPYTTFGLYSQCDV